MFERTIAIVLGSLLFGLGPNAGAQQHASSGPYVVWVYKSVGGKWAKQAQRTFRTSDASAAIAYVNQVKRYRGWTATTNATEPRFSVADNIKARQILAGKCGQMVVARRFLRTCYTVHST